MRRKRKRELVAAAARCRVMPDEHTYRSMIEPGQWVRHPTHPDWGEGQVQSAIGTRVTVNFEHQGKVLINAALVNLDILR